ncbi:MAG: metal ABC transporter permease [Proteobacteria bacterium]|nr:metal ABC transporter permease [Pseudomonadota bacterium]
MFTGIMTNTWIAGTLVAIVAGVVGLFVVIRRAAFAAHVLPLSAFPGAAAASLLGVNSLAGLVTFSGLGVLGITRLERWGRREVATALWLAASLGLGTLLLSMTGQYSQEVYSLLFGEVLGVSRGAMISIAVLSIVAVATVGVLFRPLLLDTVSPELCQAAGASSRRMELAFLGVLALSTAMVLPVVGALMVFSLMVGPASCARALTDEPHMAVLLSIALSLVTVWSAIALSYFSNWPVGFFVGALGALSYAAGRAYRRFVH